MNLRCFRVAVCNEKNNKGSIIRNIQRSDAEREDAAKLAHLSGTRKKYAGPLTAHRSAMAIVLLQTRALENGDDYKRLRSAIYNAELVASSLAFGDAGVRIRGCNGTLHEQKSGRCAFPLVAA
ncbi:hypothetical protein PLICRDRAFT_179296 [Plicaturopsis crispa FD-325 SS-3]|uniref:Uncharacterized protein n=1 Tax=Plicaturopsis crispa FD-325 SS-3 TaxID=944288 RepID=A0A0C9T6M2_PLICR|nr:hypothetical protein PLICRDRAFT_179296 [Plicaturopsis crispa FD-325 SS-3]